MRSVLGLALGCLLVVTAGCSGTPVSDSVGETTVGCEANPTYPNVTVPAEPASLSTERAIDVAVAYESAYRRAWAGEREGTSLVSQSAYDRSASGVDGGYRVTLRTSVKYVESGGPNATTMHVNRGFTATYTVTARALVREGRTVACW